MKKLSVLLMIFCMFIFMGCRKQITNDLETNVQAGKEKIVGIDPYVVDGINIYKGEHNVDNKVLENTEFDYCIEGDQDAIIVAKAYYEILIQDQEKRELNSLTYDKIDKVWVAHFTLINEEKGTLILGGDISIAFKSNGEIVALWGGE